MDWARLRSFVWGSLVGVASAAGVLLVRARRGRSVPIDVAPFGRIHRAFRGAPCYESQENPSAGSE